MKGLNKIVLSSFLLLFFACAPTKKMSNNHWFRNINICKKLTGKVLIYPVFVQSKKGSSWSDEDIKEFMDSLSVASNWLKNQADSNGIKLEVISEKHPKTIVKGLPAESISETNKLFESGSGFDKVNKHYDGLAKLIVTSIPKKEELKPIVEKVTNKERLCAKLRNIYQVESVVLMFVHQKEGVDNILFNINSLTNSDIEFIVTSVLNPNVLATQILEVFGAAPLVYLSEKKSEEKHAKFVKDNFPKDIMANPLKDMEGLNVGKYTQYLIGWHNEFIEEYKYLPSARIILVK